MLRESETSKLLKEKMLELMQTKSCLQIKVTELTRYANVSRGTFYLHYDSIYDVIQKIEEDYIEAEKQAIFSDPLLKDKDMDYYRRLISFIRDNNYVFRTLSGPNGDPSFQSRFMRSFTDGFYERILGESKIHLTQAERTLIFENVMAGRWAMYIWYASHEDEISIDDMCSLIDRLNRQVLALLT